jgi:hypothetical protein
MEPGRRHQRQLGRSGRCHQFRVPLFPGRDHHADQPEVACGDVPVDATHQRAEREREQLCLPGKNPPYPAD